MFEKKHVVLCAALALGCEQTLAIETGDIKWNGFFNAGYTASNSKILYDEHVDDNGTFSDAGYGIAASMKLPEDWSAALQLFNHGHHGAGDEVVLDWAFATYQPSDSFALRIGKIKYPGTLVSEYVDVGYAHPWFHPPEQFYSDMALGPNMALESFSGISPIFKNRAGGKQYVLQPYIGESSIDDGKAKKLVGVKAGISGDGFEVLANINQNKLVLDAATPRLNETADKTLKRWNVGVSYDRNNVVAMAEYGKSTIDKTPEFDTTAGYVTLGYRFGKFLPTLTSAKFDQEKTKLGEKATTAALRYDLNSFVAVKAQYARVTPTERDTALVSTEQPAGLFDSLPAERRVNIFSVGFNLVF